jgi:Tol biopolymer transport system component
MKIQFLTYLLVFALSVSSCSVDISQPPATSPSPRTEITPQRNIQTTPLPMTPIPVTWASLNLTGKLVYISDQVVDKTYVENLQMLDLVTGNSTVIFNVPKYSWIYYAAVSPDYKQVAISYSPPHDTNPNINRALYILPLDGSQSPQLLFPPPTQYDQYPQVEWSPDGRYIYYTHVNYQNQADPNQVNPVYEIFRMSYPDGQPEKIIDQAYWPRPSSDTTNLVYIAVDPMAFRNKLMISNADGSHAQEVVISGAWDPNIKDAPIFAPDGQSIIFSAEAKSPSFQPSQLEKLMRVMPVKADGTIPSDWWSVPITGGTPTALTQIHTIGLFASISPDKTHMISASGSGIFVTKLDGSELTFILQDEMNSGTVTWIP